MGIILGALSGAADAWSRQSEIETKARLERETHAANAAVDSNLALGRSFALENFKKTLSDMQRLDQVGRIEGATAKIADEGVGKKRGIIAGAIADQDAWTPEQQSAVDQSLGLDRQAILADPKTRVQAAISTGDISPEKAATLGQGAELATLKMENLLARAEDRNATAKEIAELRVEAARTAAEARQNGGAIGREERLRFTSLFSEAGRRLGEAQKSLATLQKQPMYSMAEKGSAQAQQLDDLRTSIQGYEEERKLYQGLLVNSQNGAGPVTKGMGGPTTAGERDMKASLEDDTGNTAADYDNEIRKVRADIANPRNASSIAALQSHLDNMLAQRARIGGPPALQSVPTAPLPLPPTKASLQAGKVYLTARGPAKWNGTAFEAR